MIQIINLEKSFANKLILDQINFVFEEGKIYGIVGENGAGKTTLFKCISGIENYKGVITSNMGVLKDKLGFLQTESFFFPKMTGNEYLQLLCNARKIDEQEFDKKNIFNLPLQQYASTYSTGMKKKLALTGILLQKNDIYILDEPFNGVDIQSNMIITEIILALKEKGKCVLISSHIFSTLKDTCDFILILKKGRIEKIIEKNEFEILEKEMKNYLVKEIISKSEIL